jgi:threonine aldolase
VTEKRFFASDNASGVHPRLLQALEAANRGHVLAYGHDPITERATDVLRAHFGEAASIFFVFGGTGANVMSLACALAPTEAVVCARTSHLWNDECAGPERFLGAKLVPAESTEGKMTPASIEPLLESQTSPHTSRAGVVSISQATEWGTVYTADEIGALVELAHARGARFHVDGARLANAAASVGASMREMIAETGVDVLSLGGTKNGMMFGEAVVVLDADIAAHAAHLQKQAMQLPSKMRFVAAQIEALFGTDLHAENARKANAAAARLGAGLGGLDGVEVVVPVEANAVFARIPPAVAEALREEFVFHTWEGDVVRLMCAFDTSDEDVDALVAAAKRALADLQ